MNPRERVIATLRGEATDRPPFALWRHFYPEENEGPGALAARTAEWTRRFGFDLVKHNPRAHYHAEPWGTRFRYDGTAKPVVERYAVRSAEDWRRITRRPADAPAFAEMIASLRATREALGDTPLLATIFTPLGVAERLAGQERLLADLRDVPDDVLGALEAIVETFRDVARACLDVADGIFYATTAYARSDVLDDAAYARFARPFDARVWDICRAGSLSVLHVCGPHARVIQVARELGAPMVSWNAHAAGVPSLAELRRALPEVVAVGGIGDDALLATQGSTVRRETLDAWSASGGRRWIAAGGCTIPVDSRPERIDDARDALR